MADQHRDVVDKAAENHIAVGAQLDLKLQDGPVRVRLGQVERGRSSDCKGSRLLVRIDLPGLLGSLASFRDIGIVRHVLHERDRVKMAG